MLISKNLTDSNVSHDEFVLINNMLKESYDMKEEIKNSNNKQQFKLYVKQWGFFIFLKCRKNTQSKNLKL